MNGHKDVSYEDIYLGRVGRRFLSVDIALIARDTKDWGGRVIWYPGGTRASYRGPFTELRLQSRTRWFSLTRPPTRYTDGLDLGEWLTDEWVRAPHVQAVDLDWLGEIARRWGRNLTTVDPSHSPTNELTLIPRHVVTDIGRLATRLVQARNCASHAFPDPTAIISSASRYTREEMEQSRNGQ